MNALQLDIPANSQSFTWTREVDGPPEVVFAVMNDAVADWWGPSDLTTEIVTHEGRTGGSWHYVQHDAEGNAYGFHGVFHEVTPAQRIVQTFEFEGMPGHVLLDTLLFEDLGDGRTRLSGQSTFQSVEDRDGMIASGMEGGMAEGYDRLEAIVKARVQA